MDVPKDLPEMLPAERGDEADENDVAIANLGSSIPPPLVQAGDAVATDDRPVASANNALDQRVLLTRNGNLHQDLAGPRVPDFQGKTVRSVIQQAAALGIPVEFTGSGIARAQAPEPGAILPSGSWIRVQFGR
jgi:cell division protein FtsI (penicillin-binding protein 3)